MQYDVIEHLNCIYQLLLTHDMHETIYNYVNIPIFLNEINIK